MIKLRLISLLFLFIMPVILLFSAFQVQFNWSEYSTWSNQLSIGAKEANRRHVFHLSSDPIFAYYFADLERGADPLYIASHTDAIRTIFHDEINSNVTFHDGHLPSSLSMYNQDGGEIVSIGSKVNFAADMIQALEKSPTDYVELAQDGHHSILYPLGLDRNGDKKLSGNERMGYLLVDFAFTDEQYQQLAFDHLQEEVIRAIVFTVTLIFMIYLASRFVGRPLSQLMLQLSNNSKKNEWYPLNTNTQIVEINHLSDQLNILNSELQKKNIQVRDARDMAVRMADAKGEFMAAISHELRTPINGIIGFSDLLKQEPLNEKQHNYLEKVAISATALHGLIDDVLDYSRINSGQLKLEHSDFDLLAVIEESLMIVSHSASLKGLELLRDYPVNLPIMINGDRKRVSQVLLNLLNNAIKFTESGTISLSVKDSAQEWAEGKVSITIKDTGIGIDKDQLLRIFEPFVQSDSSIQRRFGGSGLGLSICKQLIEMMQGHIGVSSQLHVGSSFDFSIHFNESSILQPKLPSLSVNPKLKTMLCALEQTTRSTIVTGFELAGLNIENYNIPMDMVHAAFRQAEKGDPALVCIGGSHHHLETINETLALFAGQPQNLGKSVRFIVFGSNIQESDLIGGEFTNQTRFLSNIVSRSELIQSINTLYKEDFLTPDTTKDTPDRTRNLAGYSVLIVDDNEINLLLTQEVLQSYGAQTICTTDGLSAINYAKSASFDLILMDVQMPEISGIEATTCIRALERHTDTLIFALTANVTKKGYDACMQAGMNDVVTKPFDAKKLVQLIESHNLRTKAATD